MKILNVLGHDVLLDDNWYEMLRWVNWYFNDSGYVVRSSTIKMEVMHRIILDLPHNKRSDMEGFIVDHIDGNRLNNQTSNLRLVDIAMNRLNAKLNKNNRTDTEVFVFIKIDLLQQ